VARLTLKFLSAILVFTPNAQPHKFCSITPCLVTIALHCNIETLDTHISHLIEILMVDIKKKAMTNANIEVVQLTIELNTMSNIINTKIIGSTKDVLAMPKSSGINNYELNEI
jgi:hypothetical protein